MKKVLLLLAVALAFTVTSVAQDATSSSSTSGQTSTTTKAKTKTKKAAGETKEAASGAASETKHAATGEKSAKSSTLTGCLSSSANSEGMYTLSNGRYKKGVEVGPADKVKDHAGHQVALKGKWTTGEAAGETKEAAGKDKGERHFDVDSVKHLSETCSMAPGGGTTGSKEKGDMSGMHMKKGKASKSGSTTPSSTTPPPTK